MNKRELKLKTILNEFAKWQVQIENSTSLSLYDINIFSEDLIRDLLNLIFDYKLKNANQITKNQPSIDLFDNYNRIAVQVTSTKSRTKIQSTLDKFFKEELDEKYDVLFIIILGKKQKSYSSFQLKQGFNFGMENILDFKDLLSRVNSLRTKKIESIAELLRQETIPTQPKRKQSQKTKLNRKLALKKRLKKAFLIDITEGELMHSNYKLSLYNPSLKFIYQEVIIREFNDNSYPYCIESERGQMSTWIKQGLWDLDDNGLIVLSLGGATNAIINQHGNWDILESRADLRGENPNYKKVVVNSFARIPYEFIVNYDIEPDNYSGLPTIYVEYANNGTPYEEIIYGIMGNYNRKDESKSRLTYYLDNNKRQKLE